MRRFLARLFAWIRMSPRTTITFVVLAGLLVTYFVFTGLTDEVRHFLLTLIAVVAVHLFDRLVLFGDIRKYVESLSTKATDKLKDSLTTLTTRNAESIRNALGLVATAESVGLMGIFPSRREAASQALAAISRAKREVAVLAISMTQDLRFEEVVASYREACRRCRSDNAADPDLRMLFLNPLKSPSVFRAILEDDPRRVKSMVQHDRLQTVIEDPYLQTGIYRDLKGVVDVLRLDEDLQKRTRFYAHTPVCWLVIVDDVAFFEPYTFGRIGTRDPQEIILRSPHAPVLRFEDRPNAEPYAILRRHFSRLWDTSDSDWFHLDMRVRHKDHFLREMFRLRRAWLEAGYRVLSEPPETSRGRDRRTYPRQVCESPDFFPPGTPPPAFKMKFSGAEIDVTVIDSSKDGLRVFAADSQACASLGRGVAIDLIASGHVGETGIRHSMTRYFAGRSYNVAWAVKGLIGLGETLRA